MRMWRIGILGTAEGTQNNTVAVENSMAVPQKLRQNYHGFRAVPLWV